MSSVDRDVLYRRFVERFRTPTDGSLVVPVTEREIKSAESAIARKLPESYRRFVTTFGAGKNDVPDDPAFAIAEIWQPEWIIRQVRQEWRTPIPELLRPIDPDTSDVAWKYLTPFGSEQSDGYWFCFGFESAACDDSPVYYFSHDPGYIERVADGFDDMLARILAGSATG